MRSRENLIICPVYNEGNSLGEFFLRLRFVYAQDIVFVDDGSTDNSKDFLQRIQAEDTFVIAHPKRCGYGAALITGFKFALEKDYRKVVTIDADLQHNPCHIPFFLRGLLEHEVVLGSRYVRIDKSIEVPRIRLVINKYISGLIKKLFSVDFSDPFCGYRGYRTSFLRRAQLKEESYGLALETVMELIKQEVQFSEIPIEVIYVNPNRVFLDGLDDPRQRLLYYLEVISRKKKEIDRKVSYEKKIFGCKPAS